MKSTMRLTQITAAVLLLCGGMSAAMAALVSGVCDVNGTSVCGSNGATVTPGSVLTIRGYAFDLDTLDRPADPAKGQIILRNEDTLLTYRVPIQRIEARPDVVVE